MTTNTEPIAVGVIGVGAMGRHHARVYSELPEVRLCGVTDVDTEQADQVAAEYGCESYSLHELLSEVDAVSIAVPTKYHWDVATQCINAGVHVLVEKPFVSNLEEGRKLIELAANAGVVLQVGHVERFNPAVQTLTDILPDFNVISVRADRLGPPPERAVGDDAILDLMIHDIDIVLSLFDGEPTLIEALGARDNTFVTALLQFPSGVIVALTASRVTQFRSRLLEITADDCFISVDYLNRGIELHRRSVGTYGTRGRNLQYRSEEVTERPIIDAGEPLKAELEAFATAVRDGTTPEVTGEDGLRTLQLALQIQDYVNREQRVVAR